jgi:Caspase domain
MTRHWAILIGINQYQFRQPLICAQQDAQAVYDWLTRQAGLGVPNCLLSTDTSPTYQSRSTYPTAESLKAWVDWLRKEGIQADDRLWVFFSGYGECWQGQDYLLPIDAADELSPRTWLSVRSLLSSLKTLPTTDILLLLDMNRSQSARSGDRVGRQTMTLAKELGIPTICSCQPEQFSHESSALGQGLFTAALLEGLRIHAGQSLGSLVKFLQRRLPELSEHSDRPRQDPMIMIAPSQLEEYLLPSSLDAAEPHRFPVTIPPGPAGRSTPPPRQSGMAAPEAVDLAAQERRLPDTPIDRSAAPSQSPSAAPAMTPAITLEEVLSLEEVPSPDRAVGVNRDGEPGFKPNRAKGWQLGPDDDELDTKQFLWRVVVLGGLIAIVLALGALLRGWEQSTSPSSKNQSPKNQSQNQLNPAANPNQSPAAQPRSSPMPTAPSPDPAPRLDVPQSPPADSAKILADARALIRPTSASELQQAIERASQIPPGDGRFAETQRQLDRWCRDMLDLANQRAQKGKFREAISAAQMIPDKRCPQVMADAAKAIGPWQQRVK